MALFQIVSLLIFARYFLQFFRGKAFTRGTKVLSTISIHYSPTSKNNNAKLYEKFIANAFLLDLLRIRARSQQAHLVSPLCLEVLPALHPHSQTAASSEEDSRNRWAFLITKKMKFLISDRSRVGDRMEIVNPEFEFSCLLRIFFVFSTYFLDLLIDSQLFGLF